MARTKPPEKSPATPKPKSSPKPKSKRAATTQTAQGSLTRRAARITRVLSKAGIRDLLSGKILTADAGAQQDAAIQFRDALQSLGPTFSKLGQMLSTRPDLLPPVFIDALESLQENVTPLTESQVVRAVESSLGVPWEDAFASIDPVPLAAGTIAQVHRAVLFDGDPVVLKVQRPNAEQEIKQDLELLKLFAEQTADRESIRRVLDVPAIVDHLSASLERELDFRVESANIKRMSQVIEQFDLLAVPVVRDMFTSKTLLVLDFVDGVALRQAPQVPQRSAAARQLLEAYYHQVLTEGFFHADPHPGNMKWGTDNKIYLFDLGMVGELESDVRESLVMLVMALWQNDAHFLAEAVLSLSEHGTLDMDAFVADIGHVMHGFSGRSLSDIQIGPLLQEITTISISHGVKLPAALALTAKALAQMQLATAELAPDLDPFEVAGRFMTRRIMGRVRGKVAPGNLLYEAQKASARAQRIFQAFEGMAAGMRGGRLQVQFQGTEGLETTIRRASRRLAISLAAMATIAASAIMATSARVPSWVPIVSGSIGALLLVMLVVDLLRRK